MKFFTRVKNIVNSNLNSALDKMEDPKKMIKLTIDEMTDTLAEARASLAASIAGRKRCESELKLLGESVERWEKRAEMAVAKGLDDLAREALTEKKAAQARQAAKSEELASLDGIIEAKKEQIEKLQTKLEEMKAKANTMVARAASAKEKIRTEKQIQEADGTELIRRFEAFEAKVERLEAEAEVAGLHPGAGESRFVQMETDAEVEKELAELKQKAAK